MPTESVLSRTKFDRIMADLRRTPILRVSRPALVVTCLCIVGIVGYIDYLTGYERPLLLFYLVPISLATWFGSLQIGLGMAVVSVAASMLSDLAAGIPTLGFWNAGMAFASYALFAPLLACLAAPVVARAWCARRRLTVAAMLGAAVLSAAITASLIHDDWANI